MATNQNSRKVNAGDVTKQAQANGRTTKPVMYVGYVRYTIDSALKAQVKSSLLTQSACMEMLVRQADFGYRLGISYSSEKGAYNVALYGHDHGCVHKGYGLGVFHSDLLTALRLLCTLHFEVFQERWPMDLENSVDQYSW